MPRANFSVGALAVADARANAVGPLRLTCEPHALRIELLYVGGYSLGYVAPRVSDTVSVRVPYSAVRALMRDGQRLILSIDPRVMRPYNRFALTRFGPEPLTLLLRAYRQRLLLRTLSAMLPWLLGAGLALSLWRALGVRWPLATAAAALAALLVWLLLARLARVWAGLSGRPALADALQWEISRRMGLQPAEIVTEPDPALAALRAEPPGGVLAAAARPRWLALALLSSLLVVMGALHVVQRFGTLEEILLDVPRARAAWGEPLAQLSQRAGHRLIPRRDTCQCLRPASPIWSGGMPQLSFMVTPRRGGIAPFWLHAGETVDITHAAPPPPPPSDDDEPEDKPPRPRLRVDLDLAVVNNSAVTLDSVSLVVTFATRDAQGRRRGVIERGLHWPATLKPGAAVKWRIRAEGNELRLDSANTAPLGEAGLLAAPADAFFAQRKARLSAVRMHAAAMLAYLGDARAPEVVDAMGTLAPRERAIADMLRSLFTPFAVCTHEDARHVCVHNRSEVLARAVALVAVGETTPRWTVEDLFYPATGLVVALPKEAPHAALLKATAVARSTR